MESKNAAIKLVESLVFGNESFNNAKVVREIVNNGQSIKTLIADITGQSNSHIFQLIKDGGIKVNGNTISNHTFVPEIGDEISVGKKLKLKIV
ncbi:MAG TPA: hypothetical protein VHA74_00945 [Candidatus Dojkabacteria bacterium]|nr:hypothetical protein [Candidatus Dojkabacteria bacterium]